MQRITISLPDDVAMVLRDEARRCRKPVSEVAREAIAKRLGISENGKPRDIPFAGIGESKENDLGERAEEYLAATWAQTIENDRG